MRVADRVDRMGDIFLRAARFSDRQGGGEAVERRLELALVEMRAGDATDDR